MTTQQRMVPMPHGKRVSLTLEDITWQAIDQIAGAGNSTWQQWCAQTILRHQNSNNVTREVRSAVLEELLTQSLMTERQSVLRQSTPEVLELSAVFNDKQLDADLAAAKYTDSTAEFGGFELITGADQFGRVCMWVRNCMRNGLHVAIPLPFTPDQIAAAISQPIKTKEA